MINKEEVEKIAKLARMELTEKEIEKMQKDMSVILDYFNLLKKAPKPEKVDRDIKENSTREDKPTVRDASVAERIVKAAPNKKEDYIKVKTIL
jgi:aspartyl/glutamyl-tRNA(Asn/Gln) amidotransferase C subunit